jgi:hypothetical protein
LENREKAVVFEVHEEVLQRNYGILPSVRLFFQDPTTRSINGCDITLFQRMFMAGLRLPFLEIARDFVLFLIVAPSQIAPNAWRYLFTSYIRWKTVLRDGDEHQPILQHILSKAEVGWFGRAGGPTFSYLHMAEE